jgi:hypothetical protein
MMRSRILSGLCFPCLSRSSSILIFGQKNDTRRRIAADSLALELLNDFRDNLNLCIDVCVVFNFQFYIMMLLLI